MEHFQGIGKIWYKLKHFWSNFGDIWIELFEFSEYFLFELSSTLSNTSKKLHVGNI